MMSTTQQESRGCWVINNFYSLNRRRASAELASPEPAICCIARDVACSEGSLLPRGLQVGSLDVRARASREDIAQPSQPAPKIWRSDMPLPEALDTA
jgi:hypothetical protein